MACADSGENIEDFAKFFYGMIDSHREELLYYLDEDAIMDWFGRTIVGSKAISHYLKFEAKATKHHLESVNTTGPILHRQRTYDGNCAAESTEILQKQVNGNCQAFQGGDTLKAAENLSEGMDYLTLEDMATPETGIPAVVTNSPSQSNTTRSSVPFDMDCLTQEDVVTPETGIPAVVPNAPARSNTTRRRVRFIEQPSGDSLAVLPTVRFPGSTVHFLEAQGNIDLFKVTCSAKSFKRSSDHRACTMKLGFTKNPSETGFEARVFIIIYENNRTCKRNLVSTFEDMQID